MKIPFDSFYKQYPRQVGKGQARSVWERLSAAKFNLTEEELYNKITLSIEAQIRWRKKDDNCPDWKHPATWLNGECWDDQIPSMMTYKQNSAQGFVCTQCDSVVNMRFGLCKPCADKYESESQRRPKENGDIH